MAISLYDATVASYLQGLGAVSGFLERGLEHCKGRGTDPAELVEARIHPDMLPLSFQLISVAHHSLGAIEGVKAGLFQPPPRASALSYKDLQALVANAHAALAAMQPSEIEALQGRDMVFKVGDRTMPFVAEGFSPLVFRAELLFPRHDGLRHPPSARRPARQARLHGPAAAQVVSPPRRRARNFPFPDQKDVRRQRSS